MKSHTKLKSRKHCIVRRYCLQLRDDGGGAAVHQLPAGQEPRGAAAAAGGDRLQVLGGGGRHLRQRVRAPVPRHGAQREHAGLSTHPEVCITCV